MRLTNSYKLPDLENLSKSEIRILKTLFDFKTLIIILDKN